MTSSKAPRWSMMTSSKEAAGADVDRERRRKGPRLSIDDVVERPAAISLPFSVDRYFCDGRIRQSQEDVETTLARTLSAAAFFCLAILCAAIIYHVSSLALAWQAL